MDFDQFTVSGVNSNVTVDVTDSHRKIAGGTYDTEGSSDAAERCQYTA